MKNIIKWNYRQHVKWNSKDIELKYNLHGRSAHYKFLGKEYCCTINPLTPYDDILIDIADRFVEKY